MQKKISIRLINLKGEVIFFEKLNLDLNTKTYGINLPSLRKGVYIVETFQFEGKKQFGKIIKY
ncbi:MAG: T9SS type A sorting domain-containing protein [Bacteroidales bacterium]|nr:T9SS type A sorting domain-containing protein [Bacteroidales bacterium]MCF8387688.1 T9SS type A sorting domain-containing protein [Bacteroidales bacterium]MCF8398761.1 T9SS type A sorting domain-containing protein [Bacteroidales bacterium]